MTERVALITGGAKGIGRGIALDLAAQRWKIAICYRTSEPEAKKTSLSITERGGQALAIRCDVSNPVAAKNLISQVEQQWGQIDALINGAGPYHRINLFEETVEGWNEMFTGNLHPIFYLAQAVAPGMKTRKTGRIINFSMANADHMISQPDVTAHYIAKAGVLILTRTLAKLLAPHGITVNAVSPGFIDSGSAPPEELAGVTKRIPAGYIGSIDDTVAAVRYLLSDEARYVNGANIQVSGAWGYEGSLNALLARRTRTLRSMLVRCAQSKGTSGHPLGEARKGFDDLSSVLAQRAASEGPRWTRAVEPRPSNLLVMIKKKGRR